MKRLLRVAGALTLGMGVLAQFVQNTDPTPPLTYFTVWSAILGTLTLTAAATQGREVPITLRGAATVGCVVSGMIFTLVIAPATATGTWFQPQDDFWVRNANVLMHGLGPILIAADFITTRAWVHRPWRQAAIWCTWPLAYTVTVLVIQTTGGPQIPYPFLNPQTIGPGELIAAVTAMAVLLLLIGRILLFLNRKAHPDPSARTT